MCLISQMIGSPEPSKEREMGFLPPIKTLYFQILAKNIHSLCISPLLSTTSPEGHGNVSVLVVFPEKEEPIDAF